MLFKNTFSSLNTLSLIPRYAFGAHAHKVTNVIQTKNNPQHDNQLRGLQQAQLHMSSYQKTFFYIHSKQRKLLSLYNVFSYLPTSITNQFANLVQDPKVTIASDQLHLPKISQNSIPIYEAIGQFPNTLKVVNKLTLAVPFMIAATAVMPFIAITAATLHYFIYFKSSYATATQRLVIKMQLLPETQQMIYQKITRTGCVRTSRVRLNDIEAVNPDIDTTKYKRDLVFERSMRSGIDLDMIFRVKSTGEILMFEREGLWHEQGLNHELMP